MGLLHNPRKPPCNELLPGAIHISVLSPGYRQAFYNILSATAFLVGPQNFVLFSERLILGEEGRYMRIESSVPG